MSVQKNYTRVKNSAFTSKITGLTYSIVLCVYYYRYLSRELVFREYRNHNFGFGAD
jgi:hypothetical protein